MQPFNTISSSSESTGFYYFSSFIYFFYFALLFFNKAIGAGEGTDFFLENRFAKNPYDF
jgi:hypothetical protein